MPVEIRELIIRAKVNATEAPGSNDAPQQRESALTGDERAEIVRSAVDQVLRILKTSKER